MELNLWSSILIYSNDGQQRQMSREMWESLINSKPATLMSPRFCLFLPILYVHRNIIVVVWNITNIIEYFETLGPVPPPLDLGSLGQDTFQASENIWTFSNVSLRASVPQPTF